ncbi:hypothetical protein E2C01_095648 [Portunus trituberculatus]|uniref:Uncharacterized protein n=1 Tax=Portunus trituberculatus TaxID=210409 RepID=A0A5B7JZD6_PORTR|nr:hypothetical protein [Portunus trituberculatus]
MSGLEKFIRELSFSQMTLGSQVVRGHGKERKAHQPLPASIWATPCSVLTCTAYVCFVTLSALGVGLPLRPWNICFNAHASTLNTLHYASRLSTLAITTLNLPTHPPGGLRHPSLLATCYASPYLCLLEEDRPATTPVIPTQDYHRAHKNP